MNMNECVLILEELHDTYGRGLPIGEHTAGVWYKVLGNHDFDDVQTAVYAWAREQSKAPRPADLLEGVRSVHRSRAYEKPAYVAPSCALCEDGWIETDSSGRGTVQRCPNGCLPAPKGEQREVDRVSTAAPDVVALMRGAQGRAKARRLEIGDRAYLEERGYDPDRFRIRDDMIMANPPEPKKKPERTRS